MGAPVAAGRAHGMDVPEVTNMERGLCGHFSKEPESGNVWTQSTGYTLALDFNAFRGSFALGRGEA